MENFEITTNKHIYKYFSINEFIFRTLINNELFFAKPSDFNDPFDSQFNLRLVEGSKAEKQFFENLEASSSEINNLKTPQLNNEISTNLENSLISGTNDLVGVTCFSETENEILMWSHYADKHKGICLKFDWKIHPEYFSGSKVFYSNSIHNIEYSSTENFHQEYKKCVLTKLGRWNYEKEIRSVIEINKKRNLSFNPKALVGVIFGEKTNNADIEIIKKVIALHKDYQQVKFYKANMIRKESKMRISAM